MSFYAVKNICLAFVTIMITLLLITTKTFSNDKHTIYQLMFITDVKI